MSVSPLRLDSSQVRELKERVPRAIYSVQSREVSARIELQPESNRTPMMREALEMLAAIVEVRRETAA